MTAPGYTMGLRWTQIICPLKGPSCMVPWTRPIWEREIRGKWLHSGCSNLGCFSDVVHPQWVPTDQLGSPWGPQHERFRSFIAWADVRWRCQRTRSIMKKRRESQDRWNLSTESRQFIYSFGNECLEKCYRERTRGLNIICKVQCTCIMKDIHQCKKDCEKAILSV